MSGVFLTGLNDVTAALASEAIEAPLRARKVVQQSSKEVRETMKSFAPVREGELRDSISYSTKMVPGGVVGEVGPTARRDGFPYPAAVEWGTSKMAPQAFAGPALDRHSGEFVERMAREAIGL